MPDRIVLYGDGRIEVEADGQEVVIRHGADAIDMSRAAFREREAGS